MWPLIVKGRTVTRKLLSGIVIASFALTGCGCEKASVEGAQNKRLTLFKPSDQIIKQGDTEAIMVRISRENFDDPITVGFSNLPAGIEIQDGERKIASDDTSATFTFKAAANAAPVEKHRSTITVEGPEGMKANEGFNITIKAKS